MGRAVRRSPHGDDHVDVRCAAPPISATAWTARCSPTTRYRFPAGLDSLRRSVRRLARRTLCSPGRSRRGHTRPPHPGRRPRMKPGIHPDYHPVVFQDATTGAMFLTRSTMTSSRTIERETQQGRAPVPAVVVEVTSDSHPFWTGGRRIVDSAGQVEKFHRRYGSRQPPHKPRRQRLAANNGCRAYDRLSVGCGLPVGLSDAGAVRHCGQTPYRST